MLRNYRLAEPLKVIAADERDPFVSWRHHLERTNGRRGGIDIVAPVGTPVRARTAGRMDHMPNDGTAGNSCRFFHDDNPGWRDVFSHLSRYAAPSGHHFEAGEVVAFTGKTGTIAPHLHWHLLDPSSRRCNPWEQFSSHATIAAAGQPGGSIEDLVSMGGDGMATVYMTKSGTGPARKAVWALAGDGLGVAAWIETKDQKLASAWAGAHHGNRLAVELTAKQFEAFRSHYRSGADLATLLQRLIDAQD